MSTETNEAKLARLGRELERLETEKWFLYRQLARILEDVASHKSLVKDQAIVVARGYDHRGEPLLWRQNGGESG